MSTTMADEQTAETLAPETTTTAPETPVNDGIIDLDAQEEVKEESEEGNEGDKSEEAKAVAAKAAEEAAETEKKKLSGAQRAKLREQRLRDELSAREREIEELRAKTPANTASDSEEKAPKEEDFPDWFSYQSALTAFNASKAVRDEIRKDRESRQASEREAKQADIARERKDAHAERVLDARGVIADFDQVMKEMDGVQVRNEVIEEIMSSDKSALLSYHLAKNPSKLEALNSMSGRELAREMGRLEATVKMPEAKRATSAPAPLSRPSGGAAPSSQEAELAAYMKKTYGDRAR